MFRTNAVQLKKLLDSVEECRIQLPDFQRGWVWDDERIRALLASISRGFPIGAVMMLESGGDIRFRTRPVEGVRENGETNADDFLLDGQQRLTSLYQALRHNGPVATYDGRGKRVDRWYYVDMISALDPLIDREDAIIGVPKEKKLRGRFGRKVVLDLSSPELEYGQHMMPTECLLDPLNWLLGYNDYWQNAIEDHPKGDGTVFRDLFRKNVQQNFPDYELPVITLGKETPKEAVCTVFEKVNTGGVPLDTFELVTAIFAADNFPLRDDWKERKQRLHSSYGVLHGIEGLQFLQAVTLLTTQQRRRRAIGQGSSLERAPAISCKKRDVLNLTLDEYRQWMELVEAGFIEAAKFLHRQFVFASRDVPYNTQLVPLATLFAELNSELRTANAMMRLERWYWSGIFSESYSGGTETQFALDLVQVADYVRNGNEPLLITEASFVPERLISLRTRNSAAYKGLYALQMRSGAADWRTGSPLSLGTWHATNVDIHHIFPVAYCKSTEPPIPRRLYNSAINKTPIDAETNRSIGGQSPSRYLAVLDDENRNLAQILRAHWLDRTTLVDDNFSNMFIERGQAIFDLINKAMGKSTFDVRESYRNALEEAEMETYRDEDAEFDSIGEAVFAN